MNGKHYQIGRFNDISAAESAVKEFRSKHGFTENHGRQL